MVVDNSAIMDRYGCMVCVHRYSDYPLHIGRGTKAMSNMPFWLVLYVVAACMAVMGSMCVLADSLWPLAFVSAAVVISAAIWAFIR